MPGSAVAAGAPLAPGGRVVGDRAVGDGQGRADLAAEAAALALAAVTLGTPGPADDDVPGDGAVGERDGAVLILDGPAPGVAALAAGTAGPGKDPVLGERTLGDC